MYGESDVDVAVRDECNTVEMVACQFEEGTEDQEARSQSSKLSYERNYKVECMAGAEAEVLQAVRATNGSKFTSFLIGQSV